MNSTTTNSWRSVQHFIAGLTAALVLLGPSAAHAEDKAVTDRAALRLRAEIT